TGLSAGGIERGNMIPELCADVGEVTARVNRRNVCIERQRVNSIVCIGIPSCGESAGGIERGNTIPELSPDVEEVPARVHGRAIHCHCEYRAARVRIPGRSNST